jgi:uncharacterized protein DUF6544
MWWIAWWAVVTVVGFCGVVASTNGVRFERRVVREMREMEASPDTPVLDRRQLIGLPDPVRRYLARAVGARQHAIRTVRLRHRGTFRPSLDGSWMPIRGQQHFTADPPGFVWWGRVRMFPGLWIDARDRSVNGAGNMLVTGPDDLPITFSADRYRDVDGGKAVMTPFVGRFSDFRAVDGVLVPHRVAAAWVVDGSSIEYARFDVQQVEFDVHEPY